MVQTNSGTHIQAQGAGFPMNFRQGSWTPLAGRNGRCYLLIFVAWILAVLSASCGGHGSSSSGATHNAYISLTGADSVALFHITNSSGTLTSVSTSVPQANTAPVGLALHPSGKFLFAANSTGNSISTFNVASDGTLTQAGNPTPAGVGPHAAVIDPSGNYLLVTNSTSSSISVFSIDSGSGALTLTSTFIGPPQLPQPSEIVITKPGTITFVYVLTPSTNNTINGFTFSAGVLTPVSGSPFVAGHGTTGVAVNPAGNLLYAANSTDNSVSGFQIDPSTGLLTAVAGSPYFMPPGTAPGTLAVDTTGKFLYVTAPGSTSSIWVFSITSGGIFNPITGSPFSLSAGTQFIVMEPSGKYFYIGNVSGHDVAAYSYDSTTGVPTAITGSPFAIGSAPGKMLITQ
jgi:6-phosphogluconolactonase